MIENVKKVIYIKEKEQDEESAFFTVAYDILIDRWTKSNTPLHSLAHSLNPRFDASQLSISVLHFIPLYSFS
jgi:hypothetical protein